MRRNTVGIFAPIALAICLHAQTAPSVVPINKEGHHHLVLENDYVRVYSVEVAPHSETLYHQHDLDYIFVTLGDSDVDSVRVGEKPVHLLLKDGEVRFTKGGFAHKAVNNSDKPFRNVTIEIKRAEAPPKCNCTPPPNGSCGCGLGVGYGADGAAFWEHGTNYGNTIVSEFYVGPMSAVSPKHNEPRVFSARSSNGEQTMPRLFIAISALRIQPTGADQEAKLLSAGNIRWIPTDLACTVVINGPEPARFVVLSFAEPTPK